jgi:diguanylate cyclase (GGDEF)-like protein
LALADANEQMQRESRVDSLTGVANRRHLYEELGRVSSLLARQERPLGVLAVDIDHFKNVNDEYGHAVGDTVLRNVATALKESVRAQDLVGRTGGEEFVVLLPDTDGPSAAALAERMRLEVSRRRVAGPNGTQLGVTVTIGCAAGHGVPADVLLRSADHALYAAKRAGRNQVQRAAGDSVAV